MLAGTDHEYLHQMRVAVRRLRSGLSAHQDVAGGETFDLLRRELKWVGTRLGVARDWDVFAAELLPPLVRECGSDPGLQDLVNAAKGARDKANQSARVAVRSRRYARLVFTLGRVAAAADGVITDPRCAVPVIPFATGLLEKRHDKVLERGAKLARRSPAELHALRIAIKKLRYAGEFFGSLFVDERAKLFRSRVAKLQESLGVINDQAAMPRLAQAATRRKAPGLESLLGGWSARVVHDERERLRDAWQQFRRTRKFW
jgi:CHAD domain-containing protein